MNDSALTNLRAQLDTLDDQIHDLLMARAAVVENVARDGGKIGTKIRPGRESIILRRLLARHSGALPPQAIIRFWREMFGAALIIEGGQTMAVCDGEGGADGGADFRTAAIRVAVHFRGGFHEGLHGAGRRAERALVRGKFYHAGDASEGGFPAHIRLY